MPFLLFLFLAPTLAWAGATEWVELRDGTRLEGSILSVSPAEIIMDVQAGPTIREQRTLPRAEVTNFQRARADDIAFAAIESRGLPETASSPAVYDAFIEQQLRPFMEEFAYSKHISAARRILAEAEAERDRVAAGEVKIDGTWVAATEAEQGESEIGGRLQLALMNETSEPAAGLAAFEVIDKNFANSSSYPTAVRRARVLLAELQTAVARARTELERREQEREQGLQLARVDQRAIMEQGMTQERAAVQAHIEASRQAGTKWVAPLPDAKFLDDLDRAIQAEEARLGRLNLTTMDTAVAAAARAQEALTDGRLDEARRELETAQQSWSQYVVLASLRDSLQKAEVEARTTAAEEAAAETPES